MQHVLLPCGVSNYFSKLSSKEGIWVWSRKQEEVGAEVPSGICILSLANDELLSTLLIDKLPELWFQFYAIIEN